jgi:hypothetical protein
MKLLLLTILLLYSCKGGSGSGSSQDVPVVASPSTNPTSPTIEIPTETSPTIPTTPVDLDPEETPIYWDANLYMVNFNTAQENKVKDAVEIMRKVIGSQQFKDAILNHTYQGKKTFVDNGGFTNAQIYQKILDGAEIVGDRSKNGEMDAELELYYTFTNTVGYTRSNTTRIWMNTKYFNVYTPYNVAGNLMHEWTHKLGFSHAVNYSSSRDYSVPYAVGSIMEKLGKKVDTL